MPSTAISFKRHNHRIYPCESARKQELLKQLLELHSDKSILIISTDNTSTTEVEGKNITLSNDAGLAEMSERKWDILISFEVPSIPADYITRLSCATQMALLIADETKEQKQLYPIEALLGRTITRETLSGFEPKVPMVNRDPDYKPKENHRPTASQKREEELNPYKSKSDDKKPSQRNHRHDGTIRTEGEKRSDGKPQYNKDSAEKKPWDKNASEKKPWDKDKGDKKPYDRKPSGSNDYRNKDKDSTTTSKPKRAPRVIKVPSVKKPKDS